jgi:adenosylcobinamide-GDP ribazoletransferase
MLQFTTILPLGRPAPFEAFCRHSYIYPLAGYVTGGIAAAVVLLFPDKPLVGAVLGIAAVLILSGCNHFDGLLDLGDGLMAHGDRTKRVAALTDRTIGAGGISAGIITVALAIAGLASCPYPAFAILAAEVAGRFSMAFLSAYGRPFTEGIHSSIHRFARPQFGLYAFVLCLPLVLFRYLSHGTPLFVLAVFLVMLAVPCGMLLLGRRVFGGVNGDITGASCEVTRAVVLVVAALVS